MKMKGGVLRKETYPVVLCGGQSKIGIQIGQANNNLDY